MCIALVPVKSRSEREGSPAGAAERKGPLKVQVGEDAKPAAGKFKLASEAGKTGKSFEAGTPKAADKRKDEGALAPRDESEGVDSLAGADRGRPDGRRTEGGENLQIFAPIEPKIIII